MSGAGGSDPAGGATGSAGGSARPDEDVLDSVRTMWHTRPARTDTNRKIAGVAAALGERYGIDPVLFRVVFVVGTFYGGAGLLFYLLLWLALPKVDPRTGTLRDRSPVLLVLLVLLLVPVAFSVFDLPGVLGLLVGLLALYLLHRHYSDRAVPAPPERTNAAHESGLPTGSSSAQAPAGERWGERTWVYPAAEPPPPAGTAPPSPPGDEGPAEPAPPPPPSPRPPRERGAPRHSVTLTTLGLALLASGFSIAVGASPVTIGAVTLGVLGCGMLAGAFLRGGRGLIAFAIPVALVSMLATQIPERPWNGFTHVDVVPSRATELGSEYSGSVGSITLRLQDMRLPSEGRTHTSVRLGAGATTVYLPREADVHLTCSTDFGSVDCLGTERAGRNLRVERTDLGPDGSGGGELRLTLRTNTGTVEVFRV
ncbi:PspC domain-containing protein [Actinopolyspora mortivallis]|uniref:PspC domain-containing protein n=1 Tax=Actinopolyspora mortivallis TaxID=33906 RepID=UPI0009FE07F8|nr:PspC domain-containing protein [Actinopolyspora mortivallis]